MDGKQRIEEFLKNKYKILSVDEYEKIINETTDYYLLFDMYHDNRMLILIDEKYNTMKSDISGLSNVFHKKCRICENDGLNTFRQYVFGPDMRQKIIDDYKNIHLPKINLELRWYRIRCGTETKDERTMRENVCYTFAVIIKSVLHKLLTKNKKNYELDKKEINDMTKCYESYIYEFVTTYALGSNIRFNEHINKFLKFRSCAVHMIDSVTENVNYVRMCDYTTVYFCEEIVDIIQKPKDDLRFPDILPNVDPFKNSEFIKVDHENLQK